MNTQNTSTKSKQGNDKVVVHVVHGEYFNAKIGAFKMIDNREFKFSNKRKAYAFYFKVSGRYVGMKSA
jgi:hypothetical protein